VVGLGMRRLAFICESGADVRLVEGLARHFHLTCELILSLRRINQQYHLGT
jgi:uncharacterized membrane protein YedE/YeeE